MTNIIADVAGNYDSLIRLVKKLPRGPIIFLGDLVDRGPDSNKVIDFAMNHISVLGNHEHMLLDHCLNDGEPKLYSDGIWFYNGGLQTLKSYGGTSENHNVPREHLSWLSGLPTFIETDSYFISHAMSAAKTPFDLLWNRHEPLVGERLQICGHNSHWGLKRFESAAGKLYAICLDDSRKNCLTALHLPSMEIYQEAN